MPSRAGCGRIPYSLQRGPAYHLPLNFPNKLSEFSIRMEVVRPVAVPEIKQGELANFAFSKWRDSFVAEVKRRDVALTKDLVVALPDVEKQNVLLEKAYYSHNRTTIGGMVSRDFTGGYGPEEYLVRKAMHGGYDIKANYYGSRATRLLGAVTVQVDIFTNFGRADEQHKSITIRLKEAKETVTIGQIEF